MKKGKKYTRRLSTGKKEGEPAHFGAHVNRTRFRKTGLVKSMRQRADLAIPPRGTQHKKLGKLRVSQDKAAKPL